MGIVPPTIDVMATGAGRVVVALTELTSGTVSLWPGDGLGAAADGCPTGGPSVRAQAGLCAGRTVIDSTCEVSGAEIAWRTLAATVSGVT